MLPRSVADRSPRPHADRLLLNPAARVLWRSGEEVEVELGRDGVVLEGVCGAQVADLTAVDTEGLAASSVSPPTVDALTRTNLLWPARRSASADVAVAADPRYRPPVPRLGAELTSLAARHGTDAASVLADRGRRIVAVDGASRVAAQVAALLGASGVGRVYLTAAEDVRLHHVLPGGLQVSDEGRRFAEAATEAVRRFAPNVDTAPLAMDEDPDVVVLATDAPVDQDRRSALHSAGCPHLAVRVGAGHGVVGPFVLPGRTSCLSCADLYRRDRDPAWPALAVQLTVPPRRGTPSEAVAAALAGALAAQQVLAHLDGDEPAAVDGTLELRLPDWRFRRRSWPPHPDCDCGAAAAARVVAAPSHGSVWSGSAQWSP